MVPWVVILAGLLAAASVAGSASASAAEATEPVVPAWNLVWADEFNDPSGTGLPETVRWTYDLGGGGWGNNELQTYTSRRENARVENGLLVLEARRETFTGTDGRTRNYTSARIKTQNRASWAYGRMEARIRVPDGLGLWPAFWMLGANFPSVGWPACGEIDIMEVVGREPSTLHATMHGPGYSGGNNVGGTRTLPGGRRWAQDFHLYAVEWETNRIRWLVDNEVYFTATPTNLPAGASWAFTRPQFIILNVAVGGNFAGNPSASTPFPQRMLVDYVRVYSRTSLPLPRLAVGRSGEDVEVRWPDQFPHARLEFRASDGAAWAPVATDGTRRLGEFVVPMAPGLYRLGWQH